MVFCRTCETNKSVEDFYKNGDRPLVQCKECERARRLRTRAAVRERGRTAETSKCRSCKQVKPESEFRTNWASSTGLEYYCRACVSERDRARTFGITQEQYDAMLLRQDGRCAICRLPEKTVDKRGRIKALAVDHDHDTGVIRALLCANCNKGLGNLGDSPARLLAAAQYLLAHGKVGVDSDGGASPHPEVI